MIYRLIVSVFMRYLQELPIRNSQGKYAENGAFEAALREAMEQIETHEYTGYLKQEGMETIHKYGLACCRKTCRLAYEKE